MTRIEPKTFAAGHARILATVAAMAAVMLAPVATRAAIIVETGGGDAGFPEFSLTARPGYISVADGGSHYSWGYTTGATMQLPGPTLEVQEGDIVSVTLTNALPAAAGNTSIVFPGHEITSATGGVAGLLTQEAVPGGTVTYTFTAGQPGTYQYHSGTRSELQVEMGLYGALIVRPATSGQAYNHAGTAFDREYLFMLSEIDVEVHRAAEEQAAGAGPIDVGYGPFHPEYWLINGRAGPDTMAAAGDPLLPTQPYNILPRMHPGERLLLRLVGAGRDMHPFHTHGNHARVLARDGQLIVSESDPNELAGPLLFTIPSVPGQTVDAIFEWTGKDLGWDVYGDNPVDGTSSETYDVNYPADINVPPLFGFPGAGDTDFDNDGQWDFVPHSETFSYAHSCTANAAGYDATTSEWCADHRKPIPVELPDLSVLAFGGFYSGSPYLGFLGSLPPGEGGLNPTAGYTYMWHSHTERELVNNDVFPGGMMTMLIVEAPGVPITN
jgi:FtsP/CotA-like multicopper oxidase with cupredoxin domain